MIILQRELDEAIGALISSNVNIFEEDYVVVIPLGARFGGASCSLPILVKDYCPDGVFYIVKRKDLEG